MQLQQFLSSNKLNHIEEKFVKVFHEIYGDKGLELLSSQVTIKRTSFSEITLKF